MRRTKVNQCGALVRAVAGFSHVRLDALSRCLRALTAPQCRRGAGTATPPAGARPLSQPGTIGPVALATMVTPFWNPGNSSRCCIACARAQVSSRARSWRAGSAVRACSRRRCRRGRLRSGSRPSSGTGSSRSSRWWCGLRCGSSRLRRWRRGDGDPFLAGPVDGLDRAWDGSAFQV